PGYSIVFERLHVSFVFFESHVVHLDLHSFPTRRSSDLSNSYTAASAVFVKWFLLAGDSYWKKRNNSAATIIAPIVGVSTNGFLFFSNLIRSCFLYVFNTRSFSLEEGCLIGSTRTSDFHPTY